MPSAIAHIRGGLPDAAHRTFDELVYRYENKIIDKTEFQTQIGKLIGMKRKKYMQKQWKLKKSEEKLVSQLEGITLGTGPDKGEVSTEFEKLSLH